MNCLEVRDLRKNFPGGLFEKDHEILRGISFRVRKGKVTGFVGANGSGKTTTLKCLLGFIFPDSGEVRFFEGGSLGTQALKRIGFFPERPYLYEFLTAGEYLHMHWDLSGGGAGFEPARDRVLKEVNLLGVENRRMRSFSKGMLQRIGIAQAILRRPEFLILDEPMSGLDPDGRLLMKDILRHLHKEGTSIFFSSHLLHDLEELCDDLIIIEKGELLFTGELKELQVKYPGSKLEEIFREMKRGKIL
jgi:ABC-2 type transport system ATP-binding protein